MSKGSAPRGQHPRSETESGRDTAPRGARRLGGVTSRLLAARSVFPDSRSGPKVATVPGRGLLGLPLRHAFGWPPPAEASTHPRRDACYNITQVNRHARPDSAMLKSWERPTAFVVWQPLVCRRSASRSACSCDRPSSGGFSEGRLSGGRPGRAERPRHFRLPRAPTSQPGCERWRSNGERPCPASSTGSYEKPSRWNPSSRRRQLLLAGGEQCRADLRRPCDGDEFPPLRFSERPPTPPNRCAAF